MGGSTGTITRVGVMLPTSGQAQQQADVEASQSGYPGAHEGVRMTQGTVYSVHKDRSMVKAYADDKTPIANGQWILLCHSPREIAERFGTLKKGMRVFVLYSGPNGSGAIGFICGEESERNINTPVFPNTAERGAFKIFVPGIGIG